MLGTSLLALPPYFRNIMKSAAALDQRTILKYVFHCNGGRSGLAYFTFQLHTSEMIFRNVPTSTFTNRRLSFEQEQILLFSSSIHVKLLKNSTMVKFGRQYFLTIFIFLLN